MPTLDALSLLGQQRWMVPVLAEIGAHGGARFVVLRNRLGIPRDSLVRTIDAAIAMGWVQRNPGHGHPLRPEVVLTAAGLAMAALAGRIAGALRQQELPAAALSRWSLPLIHTMAQGAERFNELARAVPQATPRALSQSLQRLVGNDLVNRRIEAGYPPISRYRLTDSGRMLVLAA
jgi:DNA-binding HxlR family transcriptional regulator